MSKTCNNCGNIMDDDANICPRCGTQYIALQGAPTEQPSDNGSYQQPQYQQPYQQQYQQPYGQPYQMPYQQYTAPAEKPMGVGSWVGTILLTSMFGIISLVLLFVWAFGNDVPIAKKNYCRAMLIIELIAVGLAIVFLVLFGVIFANSGIWEEFANEFSSYSYSF